LRHRLVEQVGELLAQAMLAHRQATALEVTQNLLHNRLIVVLSHGELDEALDIGFSLRAGEAELARYPASREGIAAGSRLEQQLLFMGELCLEALLAILELAHAPCAPSSGHD